MHTMCFDKNYLRFFSFSFFPIRYTTFPSKAHILSLLFKPSRSVYCCPFVHWYGTISRSMSFLSGLHPWRKLTFPLLAAIHCQQLLNCGWGFINHPTLPLPFMLGFWLVWSYAGCVLAARVALSSYEQWPCLVHQIMFSIDIHYPWFLWPSPLLFHDDPWTLEGRDTIQTPHFELSTSQSPII